MSGPFNNKSLNNMPYLDKSFSNKPYLDNPYINKPLMEDPYNIKPYNPTPFATTPYTINPFNTATLKTAYQYIEQARQNRLSLPDKTARYYLTQFQNYQAYRAYKEAQEQAQAEAEALALQQKMDGLKDYNDPLEINSIRDLILGSFNPHMKHSELFGEVVSYIPILNIIPDTLEYVYKWWVKPIARGHWGYFGMNALMGASELLDTIDNITKSVVMSAVYGQNLGSNLLRATFGDSTGIHNFDWDTGNFWGDLGLELICSIPTIILSAGLGAIAEVAEGVTVGTKAATEVVSETAETTGKVGTKALIKGVKELGEEGAQKFIKEGTEESVEYTMKKLSINILKNADENIIQEIMEEGTESSQKKFMERLLKAYYAIKGSVASDAASETAEKVSKEYVTGAAKKVVREAASEADETLQKKASNKVIKLVTDPRLVKKAQKETYEALKDVSGKKGILESLKLKQVARKAYADRLWFNNQNALNRVYTKVYGANSKFAKAIGPGLYKELQRGALDAHRAAYQQVARVQLNRASKSILNTVVRTGKFVLTDLDTTLLKGEFYLAGGYPITQLAKKYAPYMKGLFKNGRDKLIKKISATRMAVVVDTLKSIGPFKGAKEVAQEQLDVLKMVDDLELLTDDKAFIANAISGEVVSKLETVKGILSNGSLDTSTKERLILQNFQAITTYEEVKSMDDFIEILKTLDYDLKYVSDNSLVSSGFEQYIKEAEDIKKVLSRQEVGEAVTKKLKELAPTIKVVDKLDLIAQVGLFEKYSIKEILEAVSQEEFQATLKQVPIYKIENLLKEYQQITSGIVNETTELNFLNNIKTTLQPVKDALDISTNPKYNKLKKDIDILFNNATTPTGKIKSSIYNNLENVERFFKSNPPANKIVEELNELDPTVFRTLFYDTEMINGQPHYYLNHRLIKTLEDYSDWIPKEGESFSNSRLAKFMKSISEYNKKANRIIHKLERLNEPLVQFDKLGYDIKTSLKKADIIKEYNGNLFKRTTIAQYNNLPDFRKRTKQMLKDLVNPSKSNGLFEKGEDIYTSIQKLKKDLDAIGSLQGTAEVALEYLEDDVQRYIKLLSRADKADFSRAQLVPLQRRLYNTQQNIIKDYIMLEKQITPPNPLDNKINFFHESSNSVHTKISSKHPLTAKDTIIRYGEAYVDGKKYTSADLLPKNAPGGYKEVADVSVYTELVDNPLKDFIEIIEREPFKVEDTIELITRYDTDVMFVQFEKAAIQDNLNSIFSEIITNTSPEFKEILSNIKNLSHESVAKAFDGISDTSRYALAELALKDQGIKLQRELRRNLLALVDTIPDKTLRGQVKNAIVTTLQNFGNYDLQHIVENKGRILDDILERVQGYVNGSDPFMKRSSVDYMNKELKITEAEVFNELKKIPNVSLTDQTRHSALYDTVNQIMIWEKNTGEVFEGYMLDTEATQLVKGTYTNGNMLEISLVRKHNGMYEPIYVGKLQVPFDEFENGGYMALSTVWESLGLTKEEYVGKYVINELSSALYKDEDQMLSEFYEQFLKIQPGETVMTFNGDNFDLVYLKQKIQSKHIDANLIARDKNAVAKDKFLQIFQKRRYKSFDEMCESLNMIDYTKVLSGNKFALDSNFVRGFDDVLERYLNGMQKLDEFTTIPGIETNRLIKFYEGVDASTLNTIKELMSEDELTKIFGLDLPVRDVSNYISEALGDNLGIHQQIREYMKVAGITSEIFNEALDPELRKTLRDMYTRLVDTLTEIGIFNQDLRDVPIPSYLFDTLDSRYSKKALKQFQELLKSALPETSELYKHLSDPNFRLANLSQALFYSPEGAPIIAYKKMRGELWTLLDLSQTTVNSNNVDLFNNFARKIESNNNNIKNLECLVPHKQDIINMLEDIKTTKLIPETSVLKVAEGELQSNYAELKTIWDKIVARANTGYTTRVDAQKIVREMTNKYPGVVQVLNDGTPFVKISMNTNKLEMILPKYMEMQANLEYAKDTGIKSVQDQLKFKIEALKKTSEVPEYAINQIDTAATRLEKLNRLRVASFDELGNATARTDVLNDMGKTSTKVQLAYEIHQFLNLDAVSIRNEVIAGSAEHMKVIAMPNNLYFDNRNTFKKFLLRKKELAEVGIEMTLDTDTNRLTLSLSKEIYNRLKINKNRFSAARYILNGEEILLPLYQEMPFEEYFKYIGGNKEYAQAMYDARQSLIKMNPELAGRWGLPYFEDTTKAVSSNKHLPSINWNKIKNSIIPGDSYVPYLNTMNLGDYDDMVEMLGPLNSDYFDSLNLLGNKMINHTHKHLEYGQFILEGGLRLNSEWLADLSDGEIHTLLRENPDLRIVGLFEQKHAIGGYEVRALTNPTIEKIAEARANNLTILPYNIYATAAEAINNFQYSNGLMAGWAKLMSMYKKGWLMNPGVMIRNSIDSTLKNIAENNNDIPKTALQYTNAYSLLHKYDKAVYEIKMLDSMGRYRLENAVKYFDLPNTQIDKKTFDFLYNFLEDSGMSAMSVEHSIFNRIMKPNSNIERLARLVQYLNLDEQGYAYSEIIDHIAKTHFDYSTQTYADFVAKQVIPFWTFITNNLQYMMHLIEDNPQFLKMYFKVYKPIWDFDSLNYEELASNQSLQSQIMTGNIPLKIFGYKDKEQTRVVQTKNGPKEVTFKNTATFRMGSSFLDAITAFATPFFNIKDKLAPPIQVIMDSTLESVRNAAGNISLFDYSTPEETKAYYNRNFGSSSVQNMIKNPAALLEILPFTNTVAQRYLHKTYAEDGTYSYDLGSTTGVRTQDDILGLLPSIFGATSRWGDFVNTPRETTKKTTKKTTRNSSYNFRTNSEKYYPSSSRYTRYARTYSPRRSTFRMSTKPIKARPGTSYTYRTNSSGYMYPYYTSTRNYNKVNPRNYRYNYYKATHPGYYYPGIKYRGGQFQTIPQYLFSYMGKNRRGKSKLRSWMNMPTEFKVKSTLKRQVHSPVI